MSKQYRHVIGYVNMRGDEEMFDQFVDHNSDLGEALKDGFSILGPTQITMTTTDIMIMVTTMVKG